MSDPNQWIDPLGLMADNNEKKRDAYTIYPDDPLWLKREKEVLIKTKRNKQMKAMEDQMRGNEKAWERLKPQIEKERNLANWQERGWKHDRELRAIKNAGECIANNKCRPDYAYCTVGAGIFSYTEVTNLHNGKVFRVGASSKPNIEGAKTIGKNAISFIDQKRKIGLNDITSFMKNNFSGSCMIGHIAKMPVNSLPSNNVDIFLAGLAGNASVGAFGARLGTTVSIDNSDTSFMQKLKNYLTGDQMIGIEFGIGTPGPDFNFGYGVEANKDKTVTGLIRSISK